MNDDGFTDLIAPTHETESSVRAFKTKECDLRPNRTIQSRIHLLVQEMPYLIHETCLCMTVGALLLVGGAAVLAVQIGTKIVENSAEVLPEGTFKDSETMVNGALLVIDAQLSQGELLRTHANAAPIYPTLTTQEFRGRMRLLLDVPEITGEPQTSNLPLVRKPTDSGY